MEVKSRNDMVAFVLFAARSFARRGRQTFEGVINRNSEGCAVIGGECVR
jgi:hypothetical protein